MNSLIIFYLLPLIFSILLATPIRFQEKTITRLSTLALLIPALVGLHLMGGIFFSHNFPVEIRMGILRLFSHNFELILWIDKYTVAMLTLTHLLGLLVVKYSHGYLHLEKGFQRYFSTILFFIFGMYLLCLAGTLDIFFAGWEIVGFSSFLLIAFYRSHTRSVQNATRIYGIYRLCDVGLLLGAVLGHVLWHEAGRFAFLLKLTEQDFSGVHSLPLVVISLFLIIASLGKSAQFPFQNWPARAMEGPTPSSAIFYGALSIHAGVFLLIRTHPLWSHITGMHLMVGVIGAVTLILCFIQGKVQPTIKGQIAFASTANIGLMYIELGLGFKDLVMGHLFCHALYRCIQLLVSPSTVLDSLSAGNEIIRSRMAKKRDVNKTLYLLAMTDFSLDISWRGFNFLPWKFAHKFLVTLMSKAWVVFPLTLILIFASLSFFKWPLSISILAMYYALRALLADTDAFSSMLSLSISVILIMLGNYFADRHLLEAIITYMVSTGPALAIAVLICRKFKNHDLRHYHALGTAHPTLANLFMSCFLILAGMPVSTAFIGEDVILEGLLAHSLAQTSLTTFCLMISGLVCVKIYTHLFMGRSTQDKSTAGK